MMTDRDAVPRSARLNEWVRAASALLPRVEEAATAGRLSFGTVADLADAGIELAATDQPVVLVTPVPPTRDVKYHAPAHRRPIPRKAQSGAPGIVMFEGGEHTAIGDSAFLYFSGSDRGTPAYKVPLILPNGLRLTYGQIVALGGDFYGIPDAPISDGATPADRITRFTNAYNTLATDTHAATEAPAILAVMQTEIDAVNAAIDNGESASAAYDKLGDSLSEKWNKITGGGSWISPWYPMGRYLKLAAVNWDHFGTHAVNAYTAGHGAALQQAIVARNAPAPQQRGALMLAYAMNAFADHFLSDLFSAGHMRSPRKELYDTVTPSDVGSLLTRYMHDEDSHWGLSVRSEAGNAWHAYGDKRYFDTVDTANKALVDIAVQQSVDDVFFAFNTGTVPDPTAYSALTRIADLAAVADRNAAQAAGNTSPLFAWDGTAVLRRNAVNDLSDYTWTKDWYGWSTLTLLKTTYGPPPPPGYPQPPTTAPSISPNGWQSAKSIPPNWVAGARVRYAVSFVTATYESEPGPWSAFTAVAANQAFPTLTGVPTGGAGVVSRRIYRQFVNQPYIFVGAIGDNTRTTFVDGTP